MNNLTKPLIRFLEKNITSHQPALDTKRQDQDATFGFLYHSRSKPISIALPPIFIQFTWKSE